MKTKNRFELDTERLATTDEKGNRVYLYPEDVEGIWKNRRTIVYWFLITLYLVLPWIKINGKPGILLNIFTREFTFLGYTLHGVEPIIIFLVSISGLFFIAFLTSLFGRVWCGWACPQTVFIHTLFAKVETLIEGTARERKALSESPWSAGKAAKRTAKWVLFALMSFIIAQSFFGYLVGPYDLLRKIFIVPGENAGLVIAVSIFALILLVDFGWFREQFCIIACPYGRMQSVLMDENSLIIAYDKKRGEPRRGTTARENEGDCINCYACVKVCPTGIDIRRGTQLECIACTNCIDACDEIMDKINKPHGLIRYSSENKLEGKAAKKINFRAVAYFIICLAFIGSFFYFISRSTQLSFVFVRGVTPFTVTESRVLNNFQVKISHQGDKDHKIFFKTGTPELVDKIEIITPMRPLLLNKPEVKTTMFFKFDKSILVNGSKTIKMNAVEDEKIISTTEVVLVGPNN